MIHPGERDASGSMALVYNWATNREDAHVQSLCFSTGDPDNYTFTCTLVLENGRKLFVRLDPDSSDDDVVSSLNEQLKSGGFL